MATNALDLARVAAGFQLPLLDALPADSLAKRCALAVLGPRPRDDEGEWLRLCLGWRHDTAPPPDLWLYDKDSGWPFVYSLSEGERERQKSGSDGD